MDAPPPPRAYDVAVGVPARSEAERIGRCLDALTAQGAAGLRVGVFVLCNNCTDGTAALARARRARGSVDVHVREAVFPPERAHAGAARGAALDWAASALDPAGARLLLSTDADSRAAPDWLGRMAAAFDAGADVVAGAVVFEPEEMDGLVFPPLRRLEDRYAHLQARVDHSLDPRPHDPWPRHLWAWGANLGVRLAAYQRAGGVPLQALAEDRALVDRLERVDARVRHAPEVRVFTSPRLTGRAPGGLAALAAAHARGEELPCDAALEPVADAARRARLRRRVRRAHAAGRIDGDLLRRLGVDRASADAALDAPYAGEAWARLEAVSPALRRTRLELQRLPREIARAERLLARVSSSAGAPADTGHGAAAALWSAAPPPP